MKRVGQTIKLKQLGKALSARPKLAVRLKNWFAGGAVMFKLGRRLYLFH